MARKNNNNNNNMRVRVAAAALVVAALSAAVADALVAPAFPTCPNTGLEAANWDDSSWRIQDGNAYTRSVGKFTGMCFTVMVNNKECAASDCCVATSKRPAFMQLKLTAAAQAAAIDPANKCRLSYGTAISGANSLKRITKWSDSATGTDGKVVNVPLVWKKNAKTTTVCIYSSDADVAACTFETMCGVGATPTVPDADGSFANGCELRMLGSARTDSSACCTAPFAVEAFDSSDENRLASGASAALIELNGA